MRKFFNPGDIMKAGKTALESRANYLFRKRIKTECMKPYSDFTGGQEPLVSLCMSDPSAVERHMKIAIGQAQAFLENQSLLLSVAQQTVDTLRDAVTYETDKHGAPDFYTKAQLETAEKTLAALEAIKA